MSAIHRARSRVRCLLPLVLLAGLASPASAQVAFWDSFDRANGASLGENWTEAAGDGEINDNAYRLVTGDFGVIASLHNTTTGSANHYVRITLGVDPYYPWIVLRYTDSESAYYTIQFADTTGTGTWYRFDNAADPTGDEIGTAQSIAAPGTLTIRTIGCTIAGTRDDTIIRCWYDPTNVPSAADNWDGDTSPSATFDANPGALAVDTGTFVGIGGQQALTNANTMNNFVAGTWETGGGTTAPRSLP